jgi:hypothetical protein
MKAARVKAFGDVNQLEVVELPNPVPGQHDVIIKVKAFGLNYADLMQREGYYPGGPKPPYILGLEAALPKCACQSLYSKPLARISTRTQSSSLFSDANEKKVSTVENDARM